MRPRKIRKYRSLIKSEHYLNNRIAWLRIYINTINEYVNNLQSSNDFTPRRDELINHYCNLLRKQQAKHVYYMKKYCLQ